MPTIDCRCSSVLQLILDMHTASHSPTSTSDVAQIMQAGQPIGSLVIAVLVSIGTAGRAFAGAGSVVTSQGEQKTSSYAATMQLRVIKHSPIQGGDIGCGYNVELWTEAAIGNLSMPADNLPTACIGQRCILFSSHAHTYCTMYTRIAAAMNRSEGHWLEARSLTCGIQMHCAS
jgi:hypothetical protein